jgi:hypothetical protein
MHRSTRGWAAGVRCLSVNEVFWRQWPEVNSLHAEGRRRTTRWSRRNAMPLFFT